MVPLTVLRGRTEGLKTKTKMIKRQTYSRAGFTLVRHRILLSWHHAPSPPEVDRAGAAAEPNGDQQGGLVVAQADGSKPGDGFGGNVFAFREFP